MDDRHSLALLDVRQKSVLDIGSDVVADAVRRGARSSTGLYMFHAVVEYYRIFLSCQNLEADIHYARFSYEDGVIECPLSVLRSEYDVTVCIRYDHCVNDLTDFYERLYHFTGETMLFASSMLTQEIAQSRLREAGFSDTRPINDELLIARVGDDKWISL